MAFIKRHTISTRPIRFSETAAGLSAEGNLFYPA
jgi:hypothetical protein